MKRITFAALVAVTLAGCSDAPSPQLLAAAPRDGWTSESAWPGYTLIAPLKSNTVYLLDMQGEAVHSWTTGGTPGVAVYLTPRGTLLRCIQVEDHPVFMGGGQGGRIQELDADSNVLWDFRWDSEQSLQHHDIEELPNGNVLMIAWDRRTRAEALEHGRDPELLEGEEFWPGAIYEIEPQRPDGGKVVWSWHAWDHMVQNFDPDAAGFANPADHPRKIDINGDRNMDPPDEEADEKLADQMAAMGYADGADDTDDVDEEEKEKDPEKEAKKRRTKNADWMHTNGIDYNAELDQIAISVRRFDEVWILDHSTTTEEAKGSAGGRYGKGGDLLYRYGNPFAYSRGRWRDRRLYGQHNVQWIPEGHLGEGNLLVFNNGSDKIRASSSADEWWAPRDADGNYYIGDEGPFEPSEPTWSYEAPEPEDFYSSFISGAQRLPNGNTLICSGAQGWVFEVTPLGHIVWDFKNPFGLAPGEELDEDDDGEHLYGLFRAERYGPDDPGIVALRAAGVELPQNPGTGPATNQRVDEEEQEDEE